MRCVVCSVCVCATVKSPRSLDFQARALMCRKSRPQAVQLASKGTRARLVPQRCKDFPNGSETHGLRRMQSLGLSVVGPGKEPAFSK